jgi:hypothetical protein
MTSRVSRPQTTIASTLSARAAVNTAKTDFKKSGTALANAAFEKNGTKAVKSPTAAALKGAVTIDITDKRSDGVQELTFAKNGDLFINARSPNRPEQWMQVKPAFVRKFFEKELSKEQVGVKKPTDAAKYPSFDVTPANADGVARLHVIGGKNYVSYMTPTMPEQWYRLDESKSKAWRP